MVKHEIEIQINNLDTGIWEPISFEKIQYGLNSIVIAGTIRILVNNKIYYPIEERNKED